MVPRPGQNASSQELHNFGVGTGAGHEGNFTFLIFATEVYYLFPCYYFISLTMS